ncbi:MAG: T9SS type A sorting domain-containing protein [Prevotellaceae bacterium]|jgi:hypothetical protein|nr:T9SS type A sorting domain-containing protein [Prevotellaceae bacterium]
MKHILYLLSTFPLAIFAQFDGIVGSEGCKAIYCNDARFVEWASGCQISRGYLNITNPQNGFVTFGTEQNATGKATATETTAAVSLGDGGEAILTFQTPIANGDGADFAVFENSFDDVFLELASVEVSSDGEHYFRFPATSNTQTETQTGAYGTLDATQINNLAGKYRIGWGTPFDLSELPDDENLDKNDIRFVKIIDVTGTIAPEFATRDHNENIINDPYPTPFASGGFDLTGVGVINNHNNVAALKSIEQPKFSVFTNPTSNELQITNYESRNEDRIEIYDIFGKKLKNFQLSTANSQPKINISELPSGVYIVRIENFAVKFLKM